MKFWNRAILVGVGLSALTLTACGPNRPNDKAEANWLTDVNKAVEAARQEGRPLFIAFLGSDWSTASQAANKDILDTRAFKELADDNLVLLKVDFSRKGLTPEEAQTYASLAKQLNVDHFPLFLMADPAHGVGIFSRIDSYGAGGAVDFSAQITGMLNEFRQVLAAKMAEQTQGQGRPVAPPPALPAAKGAGSYPTPEQMLHQPSANGSAGLGQNQPPSIPSGYPSVQDLLNNKTPANPASAPSPAPAGNTDGSPFQLK